MTLRSLTKRLSFGAAAVALVFGAATGTVSAQETLRFLSWQVEDPAYGPWWRGIIEEFEAAHPGVTIEFTNVPRDSYADQMTTLFASGSPPEIVHLASFEYPNLAELGWLEDLDPWIEEAGLDLDGWAGQGKCEWNGDTVCLMLLYFGTITAYNEAMFEEAGLKVPATYEEHLEAARALTQDTDGDGFIDQYGVGLSTAGGPGQYLSEVLSYVIDAGGNWSNEQGEATLDTPEMIEALTRWKTMISENLTPLDLASGDVRQLFIEGKIAQRTDGPWLYGIIQKAEPEVLEQIKLTAPPFHPPMGGSSNILAMPSEIDDETKQLV
ncbi:MAG: sugar ABC transporter substrate-binding protein, partial [Pseudomonadota bacterium]